GGADRTVGEVVGGLDVLPAQPCSCLVGHCGVDERRDPVQVRAVGGGNPGDRVGCVPGHGNVGELGEQLGRRLDVVGQLRQLIGRNVADKCLEAIDLELAGPGVQLEDQLLSEVERVELLVGALDLRVGGQGR